MKIQCQFLFRESLAYVILILFMVLYSQYLHKQVEHDVKAEELVVVQNHRDPA